jgi:nitrate reductase NapE component
MKLKPYQRRALLYTFLLLVVVVFLMWHELGGGCGFGG